MTEPTAAGLAAGRQTRGKHAPRDYRKQTTIIMETMLTLSQANVPSCTTTICLVVLPSTYLYIRIYVAQFILGWMIHMPYARHYNPLLIRNFKRKKFLEKVGKKYTNCKL